MMEILKRLYDNPAIKHFLDHSAKFGNLSLIEEALIIAASFQKKPQPIVIVKSNLYTAQRLADRLTPMVNAPVLLFGVEESLRMETIARSPEMRAAQMETLAALQNGTAMICITHSAGMLRYLCDPKQFQKHTIHLRVNEEFPLDQLKKKLLEAGYDPVSRVDQPLCFASRGGIIDVYSINYDLPVRIEFFDNEIESIRFFDISSQRTVEIKEAVDIIPASEYLFSAEELDIIAKECEKGMTKAKNQGHVTTLRATIEQELEDLRHHRSFGNLYKYFSLLPQHATLLDYINHPYVIFSSEEEIRQSIHHIQEENIQYIQEMSQEGLALAKFSLFADPFQEVMRRDHLMIGMFADFIEETSVKLIGVEAAGLGIETGKHASAMALGKPGTLHGMRSYLLQDGDGNIQIAHSISAGLDYPGVGPEHAYLKDSGRAEYVSITDQEAMEALQELCRMEGIIPAIESAHAIAYAKKQAKKMQVEDIMIVCLSGRGDKDVHTVADYMAGKGYLN